MRTLAVLLLISVAGCSVPSYSLRSSSSTPTPLLASSDERPIALVPSVRRGHSMTWKTGAIITFSSIGVSLMGAALTLGGLNGANFDTGRGGDTSMMISGIVISALGDGGMFLGGPITWIAGIDRHPE